MKRFKRSVSVLLALMMVVGIMTSAPITASAAQAPERSKTVEPIETGSCGDADNGGTETVQFNIYEGDNEDEFSLEIVGSGEYNGYLMDDFASECLAEVPVYWSEPSEAGNFTEEDAACVNAFYDEYGYLPYYIELTDYYDERTQAGASQEELQTLAGLIDKIDTLYPERDTEGDAYRLDEGLSYYKDKITSITVKNLCSIGDRAFEGMAGVKRVVLETTSVEMRIEDYGGTFLQTSGVEQIGESAFNGCVALESITIPRLVSEGPGVSDPTVYITFGNEAFANCVSLVTAELSSSVNYIPDELFSGCASLAAVNISRVNDIGIGAFLDCEALENIDLYNVSGNIGSRAFENCQALKNADLTNVSNVGESAFVSCAQLESVAFGAVCEIDESAFEACTSLTSVDFTDAQDALTIRACAFKNCSQLETVVLPNRAYGGVDLYADAFAGIAENAKIFSYSDPEMVSLNSAFGSVKRTLHVPARYLSGYKSKYSGNNLLQFVGDADQDPITWAQLVRTITAAPDDTETTITLAGDITAGAADGDIMIFDNAVITIDLNGYTLDRGLYTPGDENNEGFEIMYGSGSAIVNYGKLKIKDSSAAQTGTIKGALSTGIVNSGEFTLESGTVMQNAGVSGGGICNTGTGVVTVSGGKITNNAAFNTTISHDVVDMNGNIIYHGEPETVPGNGGGICNAGTSSYNNATGEYEDYFDGTVYIYGGTITGNKAESCGGGLYGGGFVLKGAPVVKNNTLTDQQNGLGANVYLPKDQKITIDGALTFTDKISVCVPKTMIFTSGFGANNEGHTTDEFFENDGDLQQTDVNGEGMFAAELIDSWSALRAAVETRSAGMTEGDIILTQNITPEWYDEDITVSYKPDFGDESPAADSSVVIDLNGCTIDTKDKRFIVSGTSADDESIYTATLTLKDSIGTAKVVGSEQPYGLVYMNCHGRVNIEGGTYSNNSYPVAVFDADAVAGDTLTLSGGAKLSAADSCTVDLEWSAGRVVVRDAEVSAGSHPAIRGMGSSEVYVSDGGAKVTSESDSAIFMIEPQAKLVITGGTIKSDNGYAVGGEAPYTIEINPIYSYYGSGSEINISSIYLVEGQTITIASSSNAVDAWNMSVKTPITVVMETPGEFTSNYSSNMYLADPTKYFRSGTQGLYVGIGLGGEAALSEGASTWAALQARLDNGETYINVTADITPGEGDTDLIIENPTTINLNGHTIDRAASASNPGRVMKISASTNLLNGTIKGGCLTGTDDATGSGAGIYMASNLTLSGVTITGNVSVNKNGGAIYQYSGNLTVPSYDNDKVTISNNSAVNGGGLFVRSAINLQDFEMTGNTAQTGGAVYIDPTANMQYTSIVFGDFTITNNTADLGAGMYLPYKSKSYWYNALITFRGVSVFTGNKTTGGDEQNIYFAASSGSTSDTSIISVLNCDEGSCIGVSVPDLGNKHYICTPNNDDEITTSYKYLVSDNPDYGFTYTSVSTNNYGTSRCYPIYLVRNTLVGTQVSVGEDIGITYTFDFTAYANYVNPKGVVFSWGYNDSASLVAAELVQAADGNGDLIPNVYTAKCRINAKEIGDTITADVKFTDTGTKLQTIKYSVKDNLLSIMNNENESDSARKLAKDLLIYGTEAQNLFDYRTYYPAYSEEYTVPEPQVTANTLSQDERDAYITEGLEYYAHSIKLMNNPVYVLYFRKTGDALPRLKLGGTELVPTVLKDDNGEDSNYVCYEITTITPYTFSDGVTLTIGDKTFTHVPAWYVKSVIDGYNAGGDLGVENPTQLYRTSCALYNYCASAKQYAEQSGQSGN